MIERDTRLQSAEVLATPQSALAGLSVCMHVLGVGLTDMRVMRAAHAVAATGADVTVVDIEHDEDRPAKEDVDGLHFRHISMPGGLVRYYQPVAFARWIAFKAFRILRGIFAVLNTPADVYHAHDITALPACYIAAVLRRKLLIYDAHELPLVDPHQTKHRLVWFVSTSLLKLMMPRCNAVITVSPPLAPELQKRYGGPRAGIVRNMPPYQSPRASDRIRQTLGLGPENGIALYQGNFQLDRGLDVLMEASRHIAPQHRIVAMGKDLTHGEIAKLVEQAGVGERFKILPPVPYEDLIEWTASADLGLIIYRPSHSPNVKYCLPNKVFEYLMAGIPVLATSLDAVADLLATYDAGTVVSSVDPVEVARTINLLLDDPQTLVRMRHNALVAAHELSWEHESQRLVDLYQEDVVAGTRKGHMDRKRNRTGVGIR